MMYGIPNMKLEKRIIDRRLDLMKASGIKFVLNTEVGKNVAGQELVDRYDAVLLCTGAAKSRGLDVAGTELKGVHMALDFLKANTKSLLDSKLEDGSYINARGRNVIVIGGGDTGTDCVATAIRHGCASVCQLEIMPKPPEQRIEEKNPWPEWPKKYSVDYGQQEAMIIFGKDPRNYLISTKKFVGDENGAVSGVSTVEITWEKDAAGSMVMLEVPGSEKVWQADLVLLALGFLGPEDDIPEEFKLERDARGNVKAEYEAFKTNIDKVFAAGDMRRGQSLIVWAIQEGKLAAREVDKYLTGRSVIK